MAEERGVEVGEEVGYAVRFENRTSGQTKIKYLTGVLTGSCFSNYSSAQSCGIVEARLALLGCHFMVRSTLSGPLWDAALGAWNQVAAAAVWAMHKLIIVDGIFADGTLLQECLEDAHLNKYQASGWAQSSGRALLAVRAGGSAVDAASRETAVLHSCAVGTEIVSVDCSLSHSNVSALMQDLTAGRDCSSR